MQEFENFNVNQVLAEFTNRTFQINRIPRSTDLLAPGFWLLAPILELLELLELLESLASSCYLGKRGQDLGGASNTQDQHAANYTERAAGYEGGVISADRGP